jgi:hypothetical protein
MGIAPELDDIIDEQDALISRLTNENTELESQLAKLRERNNQLYMASRAVVVAPHSNGTIDPAFAIDYLETVVKQATPHIELQEVDMDIIERLEKADYDCPYRNSLLTEAADTIAQLREIEAAAKGLAHGEDWNNGTHAKIYRPQLLAALTKQLEEGVDEV